MRHHSQTGRAVLHKRMINTQRNHRMLTQMVLHMKTLRMKTRRRIRQRRVPRYCWMLRTGWLSRPLDCMKMQLIRNHYLTRKLPLPLHIPRPRHNRGTPFSPRWVADVGLAGQAEPKGRHRLALRTWGMEPAKSTKALRMMAQPCDSPVTRSAVVIMRTVIQDNPRMHSRHTRRPLRSSPAGMLTGRSRRCCRTRRLGCWHCHRPRSSLC